MLSVYRMHVQTRDASNVRTQDARTARILAKSIYKDMKRYGIPQERILEVASELIGLVSQELDDTADLG